MATKKTEKIKARNLKGVTILNWLVLNKAPKTANGNPRWLCRCVNCGLEKIIAESTLVKARPIACNCPKGKDKSAESATTLKVEISPKVKESPKVETKPKIVKARTVKPSIIKPSKSAKKPVVKAMSNTQVKLYTMWLNVTRKCSPADPTGKYYSQGIKLAKEWQSFKVFADWADAQGYNGTQKLARKNQRRGFNSKNCYFE